ncbi:AI-2E family transporter [Ornithinicoccus hortensis]|uniref:Putative PurR-regulated permease PerM n=1 Tax=Ornithinicoccus hortensis TaxID=82346 RepID=A0A542YV58_9MICO|nr:AI-2E family transporter [Ornithinicoccus hortensis]TQL51960.1 putative PurR-regulated permease PerM [Ornithinicoccus hortensis]
MGSERRRPLALLKLPARIRTAVTADPGPGADGNAVNGSGSTGPDGPGNTRGPNIVRRWRTYRERQLDLLAESNRLRREQVEAAHQPAPSAPTSPPTRQTDQQPPAATEDRTGSVGINIRSPFYFGFVAALGVFTAYLLATNLARLSSVITFILVAFFLTVALNPLVEALTRRGLPRPGGVFVVFLGLLGGVALLGLLVVPPIVSETGIFFERAPRYIEDLEHTPWFNDLDDRFDLTSRFGDELERRLSDSAFVSTVFGGVLGAAGWVAISLVGIFTTLILTLYFLAALPAVKDAAYRMVPASRRPRVIYLAEEIMRRVGGYALGQILVATVNGLCSWIMMEFLDIPYAVVLAALVGILGLIPLIGATLGAAIVAAVALFQDPTLALIVIAYYVIYQQIENYVIVPRIMHRTVSVPGAVTVVAVLAGGTLLGVLGALIAIPVAAGLLLLYEELLVPRQAKL